MQSHLSYNFIFRRVNDLIAFEIRLGISDAIISQIMLEKDPVWPENRDVIWEISWLH